MKRILIFTVGVLFCLAPYISQAAGKPKLRAEVLVDGDVVTIGDFFKNAGALADIPLFEAPNLGDTGLVDAWFVINTAMESGLRAVEPGRILNVAVTRNSIPITEALVVEAIREQVSYRTGRPMEDLGDLSITLTRDYDVEHADPASLAPYEISAFQQNRNSFSAHLSVDQGVKQRSIKLTGFIREEIEIITLARPFTRREIVTEDDIVRLRVPRAGILRRLLENEEDVVGMAARRNLQAGRPLLKSDFEKPQLINRGEDVVITLSSPNFLLTVSGQALEAGAKGDFIRVINTRSKRIIEAQVEGPGRVVIRAAGLS